MLFFDCLVIILVCVMLVMVWLSRLFRFCISLWSICKVCGVIGYVYGIVDKGVVGLFVVSLVLVSRICFGIWIVIDGCCVLIKVMVVMVSGNKVVSIFLVILCVVLNRF